MKYLILGAGSFAGQAYLSHLLNLGVEVYAVNRSIPRSSYMWPWLNNHNVSNLWFNFNIVDNFTDIMNVLDTVKPNVVIDFMGQGMVAQSWNDPALWFDTNITKKSILLKHLSQSDYLDQYIRASTPEVFGSSLKPQTPSSPFSPTTPYAVSHAAIDSYIRCLGSSYGFPYKIGRFSNFYGVGQQLYRVIPRMILSCLTGTKFVLDGGGTSLRSFICSNDFCQAFDLMISTGSIHSEYNFSGDEEISILSLIDKICSLNSVIREDIVEFGPERLGKDQCYRLNCQDSLRLLGWRPVVSLDEGITSVISWLESNLSNLSKESWSYVHKR